MLFALLILLIVVPRALSQVPDDRLIVPGQRIGKWTLEMSVDDLVRMNGGDYFENKDTSEDLRSELLFRYWLHLALLAGYRRGQTRIEYLGSTGGALIFPSGAPTRMALKEKYPDIVLIHTQSSILLSPPARLAYQTANGIGLNYDITPQKVIEAFGAPTGEAIVTLGKAVWSRMTYDEIGIAFGFEPDAGGRPRFLRNISVFRPKIGRNIWKF